MKKIFTAVVTLLFLVTLGMTANAAEGVSLTTFKKVTNYDSVKGSVKTSAERTQVLVSGKSSKNAYLIDLTTGESLKSFTTNTDDITVNDAATYYAYTPTSGGKIAYKKGTNALVDTQITGQAIGFLKDSNILIAVGKYQSSTVDELIAYNVATGKLVFKKTEAEIGDFKDIEVGKDLVIVGDRSINVYNQAGVAKETISFTDNLSEVTYSEDGSLLVVATVNERLRLLETTTYEELSRTFTGSENAFNIVVDSSNKYIALANTDDKFRIYNVATGKRIYSTLDDTKVTAENRIALSKGAKYILLNDQIYSGTKLNSYAMSISLASKYKKLELGQTYTPEVTVTYANNTTATVKKEVEWDSDNVELASINSNVLKARKLGTFILQANYLDLTTTKTVTVVDTLAPELKGVKNISVYSDEAVTKLQGVTAKDLGEGSLTSKIKVTGAFNANKPGKYKLKYTVSDTSGNTTTLSRTITVMYNPIMTMYLFKSNGILAPINLFTNIGELKNKPMAATFAYTSPKVKTSLVVQTTTSKKLTFKDLTIQANGKKLKIKTTGSTFLKAQKTELIYKDLTAAQRTWIKKNINPNKKVKFVIHTKSKTMTKTLTKKQKQGFLDGVLVYDYLKSKEKAK